MGISDFGFEQREVDVASLRISFTNNGRDISGKRFRQNGSFFLVIKLGFDGPSLKILSAVVGNLGTDHQGGIGVVVVKVGLNEEITDVDLWGSEEVDVSVDAAEPPHVLVFEIAAIGPAVDFDGEYVFACL